MARGRPNWDHDSASCFPHRFTDEERRLLFDALKRNDQRAVEFVDALERLTSVYQIRREEEKNKPTTADRIAAADEIQDLSSKLASRLRGNTVAGLSDWLYTSQVTAVPDIENLRDTLDRLALVCGDAKSRMQEVKKPGARVNLARKQLARKIAFYFPAYLGEQASYTQATDAAKEGRHVGRCRLRYQRRIAYSVLSGHGGCGMNKVALHRYNPSELADALRDTTQTSGNKQQPLGNELQVDEIRDFLALELPPRDHILTPWLPTQGLAMVYAPRGVGKTFFALGVAYAVASAGKFLGWKAPQAKGVLIIDGEMPAAVLQERLANIVTASDVEPTAALRLITPDCQPKRMLDLTDADDQAALSGHLDNIDFIIVDNISTLCRTGRENEAEGWLPVQQWALQQRASGRSVLFVHHAGKGGAQRGTSRREGILDTVIALKHPPDYTPEQGASFEVHFEKSRGFYGQDSKPFEARLITDAKGRQAWAVRGLEDSTFDRVVNLHQESLSPKDICIELGIHRSQVSRHLKRARAEGRISKENGK
jgi:hypothetical protein